jgi:uncharacterized protein YgbK (DUF1537 family)
MRNWLILADDLTGAADCAVAFARRGHAAEVRWGDAMPDIAPVGAMPAVLAIDVDSRGLDADTAALRHAALVRELPPGRALLKKIDSTLRGQPIAELAATLRVLRSHTLAIVAPAFPATGRTTEAGRVWLQGAPLEQSPLWQRDHSYASADLPALLTQAGLPTATLSLATLRQGGTEAAVRDALAQGQSALVCDAVTVADLAIIAAATLPLAAPLLWVGSGGLAQALADQSPAGDSPAALPHLVGNPTGGGLLLVVGSLAEVSRQAAAALLAQGRVRSFGIAPALLSGGTAAARSSIAAEIAAAIRGGEDVLVMIEAAGADLSQGAALAAALGDLLHPAAQSMGGLFATGGETARALLDRLGVRGLRLLEDIEPGMPLAISRGARQVPVVTKAGGFGHPGTMIGAHRHLRALLDGKETCP